MKTISLRELAAPWAKLPSVILMFAGVWLAGAVGLAAVQFEFPAERDTIIPAFISIPFEPTRIDRIPCESKPLEVPKLTDCENSNLSVSNSLHKDVFGLSGKKIGTIEDFMVDQEGRVSKVKILLDGTELSRMFAPMIDTSGLASLKNEIESIQASNLTYMQKDGKNIYYLDQSKANVYKWNAIPK